MLAQQYLAAGKSQEALKLCDAGLANFPFYTTGHLVKGKSLIALNLLAEARREFEFVLDFLPGNNAVTALLASIPRSSDEILAAEVPAAQPSAPKPSMPSAAPVMQQASEALLPPPPAPAAEENNFGMYAAPSSPPESDFGFGISTPLTEPQPQSGFPERTPAQPGSSDTMAQFTQTPADSSSPASPEEDPFGFLAANSFEPPQSGPSFDIQSGAFGSSQQPPANLALPLSPEESASFDVYAERKKNELTGINTLTFEEFKKSNSQAFPQVFPQVFPEASPSASPETAGSDFSQDHIGELTEKLQNVQRMTPVINFAEKETPALSTEDATSSMGFVTPTLAEIYAKQGWY